MSPIVKPCRCGALIDRQLKFCPSCQRADDQRRNAKRKASGRTTAAWNRLRTAAIDRDGYACRRCGRSGTVGTLTVHLRPELSGNHWTATLDDLETLCRSCHGSVDAPRAAATRTAQESSSPPEPSIG